MARKPRFNLPGVPQHVIAALGHPWPSRHWGILPGAAGNNREPCFYGDGDYHHYLDDLREAADRNDCRLHAYVLMTNHVHLLMTPMVEHGVAHLMQDLGRKYVRYIN
jgi:putative transposase